MKSKSSIISKSSKNHGSDRSSEEIVDFKDAAGLFRDHHVLMTSADRAGFTFVENGKRTEALRMRLLDLLFRRKIKFAFALQEVLPNIPYDVYVRRPAWFLIAVNRRGNDRILVEKPTPIPFQSLWEEFAIHSIFELVPQTDLDDWKAIKRLTRQPEKPRPENEPIFDLRLTTKPPQVLIGKGRMFDVVAPLTPLNRSFVNALLLENVRRGRFPGRKSRT